MRKGTVGVWSQKAERFLDLPDGALSGEARVEIFGHRHLCAQGLCDILEYETDRIRLKTRSGEVRILGDELVIEAYHTTDVVIGGRLLCVEFM